MVSLLLKQNLGVTQAATLTIAEARAAGAGLVAVLSAVGSMTTGWHLSLLTEKEGESFSRVFGNKYNLTKKENNFHLVSEDAEIQPLFFKDFNVKVCVFYS